MANCTHISNIVVIQMTAFECYLNAFSSPVGNFDICASLLCYAQERSKNRCSACRDFASAGKISNVGTEKGDLLNLTFNYVVYAEVFFLTVK